jgi:hypothetical protein
MPGKAGAMRFYRAIFPMGMGQSANNLLQVIYFTLLRVCAVTGAARRRDFPGVLETFLRTLETFPRTLRIFARTLRTSVKSHRSIKNSGAAVFF